MTTDPHPGNETPTTEQQNEVTQGNTTLAIWQWIIILAVGIGIFILAYNLLKKSSNSSFDFNTSEETASPASTRSTITLSSLISSTGGSSNTYFITRKIILRLDMPNTYIVHNGDFICNGKIIKDSDHTPEYKETWLLEPVSGKNSFLTITKN